MNLTCNYDQQYCQCPTGYVKKINLNNFNLIYFYLNN